MSRNTMGKLMVVTGLLTLVLTFWGTSHYVFPFYAHTYPFAWYGLIVFLDGWLWWRWDEGLVLARPREFITLLFWSFVFWFFFEIWNLRLQNWYYAGAPSQELWSHVEAYLDFATVLPGMFLVYRLLCRLRIPRQVRTRAIIQRWAGKACLPVGCVMLALPLLCPACFFPFVWGAFIFLLEPICSKWDGRSLLKDAEMGDWTTFVRLLIAGVLCGGYWELCNFWSLAKWVYTVPFFSEGKLFEMPYLGFLGFPPFCVECFVMINALYLLRGGRHWDTEAPRRPKASGALHKTTYLLIILLGLLLSEWSYGKMNAYTIDSRSESLQKILEDISHSEAGALNKKGWRYPEEILEDWDQASTVISMPLRDRIRHRLKLVSTLNMGSANARLLEGVGIHSREELAHQSPDELFVELARVNQALQLRKTPLVKRRIEAWIHAAKRQSPIY
jgi:hypothetical protein